MVVHRGRPAEHGQYVLRDTDLSGPGGQRVQVSDYVIHLPRDPGRSEVEVYRDDPPAVVVNEDEKHTLGGLLRSTASLVGSTGRDLLELWRWRNQNPKDLRQPAKQWGDQPSNNSTGFTGFTNNSVRIAPDAASLTHPILLRRYRAAALVDPGRASGKTVD